MNFPDRPGCTTEELRIDVRDTIVPAIMRRTITCSVAKTPTAIAHGLGVVPTWVGWSPRADARVWRSADPDDRFIYLTASDACTVDIEVSAQ